MVKNIHLLHYPGSTSVMIIWLRRITGQHLEYYQKSLIAVVNDFDNPDIYSNPDVDSSLFDIRLLEILKSKARALELFANDTE